MIPNNTKVQLFDGNIDLVTDTIRIALYNNSTAFTPDPDVHAYVADVFGGTTPAATEFADTNYSRLDVPTRSTRQNNTADQAEWDAGDVTWTALGGTETIQGAIIYRQVGADDTTPADDEIIRIIDDATEADLPLATNGSDVTIAWDASGIATLG